MDKQKSNFSAFQLLKPLLKAIKSQGFSEPTPIQVKSFAPILSGNDFVGMARTGSGKTAAFVIPILQKLKCHTTKFGSRVLILSPNRELALQTFALIKELSKYMDIRSISAVGGEALDDQFASIASNPDIIVATPGRFIHLVREMKLSMASLECLVLDEADRLFEMGFYDQLLEIISLLPENRQMILFSATLPKNLSEFTKVGLCSPIYARLDDDQKLSSTLKTFFFYLQSNYKEAALLLLVQKLNDLKVTGEVTKRPLTLIFVSTKHHAEFISSFLEYFGFNCKCIYGSLDQEARNIAISEFKSRKITILIVTDVAARGVDIPLIDNVINYDFPDHPKLFIHRVGRTARAGSKGFAYSFISTDELPYFLDLQLMIGNQDEFAVQSIPLGLLENSKECFDSALSLCPGLNELYDVSLNSKKLYLKTRKHASSQSYDRAKTFKVCSGDFFGASSTRSDVEDFLLRLGNFRKNSKQAVNLKDFNLGFEKFSDPKFYLSYTSKRSKTHDYFDICSSSKCDSESIPSKPKLLVKKSKGELFEKWKKKTHLELPRIGQSEISVRHLPDKVPRSKKEFIRSKKIKT